MHNHLRHPPAGSVVSVGTHLFYRHKGIVSDRWHNGQPMVISCSARAGAVVEEPWHTFANGAPVRIDQQADAPTANKIVYRARSHAGKPYHVFAWNCEHLVAAALGERPQSPQLAATLVIGLIVLLAGAS